MTTPKGTRARRCLLKSEDAVHIYGNSRPLPARRGCPQRFVGLRALTHPGTPSDSGPGEAISVTSCQSASHGAQPGELPPFGCRLLGGVGSDDAGGSRLSVVASDRGAARRPSVNHGAALGPTGGLLGSDGLRLALQQHQVGEHAFTENALGPCFDIRPLDRSALPFRSLQSRSRPDARRCPLRCR